MRRFLDYLFSLFERPFEYEGALRLFSRLTYTWLFCMALSLWSERHLIWGNDSVLLHHSAGEGLFLNFANMLNYRPSWFGYVYYPHIVLAALSIVENRCSFIFRILTWLTGLLLYYSGYPIFNSSYLLMLLMAFYMSVVNTSRYTSFQSVLNRMGWYVAVAQLMIVYLISGISKCIGSMWLNGEAIYYTLRIDRFSWGVIIDSDWIQNAFITKSLNYFVMLFQLLFPLFIFLRKWKDQFLIVGLVMHLIIGTVMHLWDFATAMIFCYSLFLRKK